jgi:hypothetical protein
MTDRLRRGAAATCVLALLGSAVLALSACGGAAAPKLTERTLTFTERDTDFFSFSDVPPKTTLGDAGPQRLSNRDQLTFASDLLGRRRRRNRRLRRSDRRVHVGRGARPRHDPPLPSGGVMNRRVALASCVALALAAAPSALGAGADTITVVQRRVDTYPGETTRPS